MRRYRGDEDLPALVKVIEGVFKEDGLEWVMTVERLKNEYDNLPGFDPMNDVVLAMVDDQTVGYCQVRWFEEPNGKFAAGHREKVLPKWRGRGIARALLAVNTVRARELMADHARGPARMGTVVADTEVDRLAMLEAAGYQKERYYLEMLRDLGQPIEVLPMPADIEVRPPKEEDLRRVLEAQWEAFRDSWSFREMTDKDWTGFLASPEFQPDLWVVGWDGDVIAGSVFSWIDNEENDRYHRQWGYNDGIAVTKEYRRRGLARALTSRSLVILRDAGMQFACLSVDTQNPADAMGLYSALGYTVHKEHIDLIRPMD
jgi:ribosomal protein S18 acetylase RimI-like enzyme